MMRLFMVLSLTLSMVCSGQELVSAPPPKPFYRSMIFWSNTAMWGSSVLAAKATWYGTRQCVNELTFDREMALFGTSRGGGLYHPYKKAFMITLPIDGAVTAGSYFLHRHHHNTGAILLPSVSAASQASVAGELYLQGCI